MEFSKKKIIVVGLGKSGVSVSRWLSSKGAYVTISDIKSESDLDRDILKEAQKLDVKIEAGEHRFETFVNSDMIIVSPGVPLDIEPLKKAEEKEIPIIGEMELAAREIKTPIIAVTGTNGKSTAVSMLESMINTSGMKMFVGGNIGTPLTDYITEGQDADYVLLEVSSFQLDTMESFHPMVSLLLNISPDHLDRYVDYEEYVQSKLKIFANQGLGDYAVLNDDDRKLAAFRPKGGLCVLRYGMGKEGKQKTPFLMEKVWYFEFLVKKIASLILVDSGSPAGTIWKTLWARH